MIKRYSRPKMAKIWTLENKFQKWLDIELAACYAHMKMGTIPKKDYDQICKKAKFDVTRIEQIEAEVNHDVIAFLTSLSENIGPSSRYVHLGLTSSDIVDTAFSMLIKQSGEVLLDGVLELLETLKVQAKKYKLTPIMGRTHGMHAEPTTVGLKLSVYYQEMQRNKQRLLDALDTLNVGKLSGAVGNYAHIPPKLEEMVCNKVGLSAAKISTQIIQRDRHAQFMSTLAIIGGTLEKIATEIRSLQKTECNEILEPFGKKQKGSSAMPHKKNPITCERISGLARMIRGYALTALENQNLWHERDISHSSTERILFPDATILLDYMLGLMCKVINGMVVNADQMQENIGKSYNVFFSQQLLLKMVEKGMLREEAYRVVQKNALDAYKNKIPFDQQIQNDNVVTTLLTPSELEGIFDFSKYTKHIDLIFKRVY